MRILGIVLALTCVSSLLAEEPNASDAAFAAALDNVLQELHGAPPINLEHQDDRHSPTDVVVVAQRTIGGAPVAYRAFVDKYFGSVIAEELLQSYGDNGPASRKIDQANVGRFTVLPLEKFETGPFDYDWQRLNQEYPNVRFVVRVSWPAVDRLGTYAVVRYELIGRDRPATLRAANRPWQHASFVKFEKQKDGSWKRTIGITGGIWN